MSDSNWQVYMIESSDGSLYTGVSTDARRRFDDHLKRPYRGARFFRGRKPVKLVFIESGHDQSSACKREAAIKRLSRGDKLALIRESGRRPNR